MNGVVHINWHAPLAISGCDDWGPFEAGGHGLSSNRRQRPLSPVKDTSLRFPSQARRRPGSAYACKQTHTRAHMLAFGTITGFRGRWLYYCCCNTALIQGRSDPSPLPLHFGSAGSNPNPARATWMVDTKRGCTYACHMHQMSLRSICCHAASDGYRSVMWKRRELNGGPGRPERETDKWGKLEPHLTRRRTQKGSPVVLTDPRASRTHRPEKARDTTSKVTVPKTAPK